MAKRKRLTLPDPTGQVSTPGTFLDAPTGIVPDRVLRKGRAAPIADVAADAASNAALDQIADTLRDARNQGRMVLNLPLEAIQTDYLVRDRIVLDAAEMAALKTSLQARGQQTPIEVTEITPGQFGLISGWRRLQALKQLKSETTEGRFDTVQALLRKPQDAAQAYLAMVEENEIRVGLGYYERARIAAKAVEQDVYPTTKKALMGLFGSASRAKRSKIGTFLHIVDALDSELKFPGALGERAGLLIGRALADDPKLAETMCRALAQKDPETAEDELAVLQAALGLVETSIDPVPDRHATAQEQSPPGAPTAPVPPRPKAHSQEVVAGVQIKTHTDGSLTLSGANVTADLRSRLLTWLEQQN